MKIKLIVTDLDGTLLNTNDEINDKDKDALLYAQQQGIDVMVVTGRPLEEGISKFCWYEWLPDNKYDIR